MQILEPNSEDWNNCITANSVLRLKQQLFNVSYNDKIYCKVQTYLHGSLANQFVRNIVRLMKVVELMLGNR